MSEQKKINDGVYGFVSGTVGRAFSTKNGRAFELNVKDAKQQYPDKWTIWGDLPVVEGDRVSVKGWLGISRETYEKDGETKVAIRRAVNMPVMAAHEPQGAASATVADQWATTPPANPGASQGQPAEQGGFSFDDQTPF